MRDLFLLARAEEVGVAAGKSVALAVYAVAVPLALALSTRSDTARDIIPFTPVAAIDISFTPVAWLGLDGAGATETDRPVPGRRGPTRMTKPGGVGGLLAQKLRPRRRHRLS